MSLQDKLKSFVKILKVFSLCGGSALFITYHIRQTCKSVSKIVNSNVLDREKKHTAEYIYIDDPLYDATMLIEQDRENKQSVGLARIWKSLRHSLAWRLLWLCRHGNREQRNVALEQLASFKNNKVWDCLKLAQALDKNTAVLLARTFGADLRYFLPPPVHVRRAVHNPELVSFKLRDMIMAIQTINPHGCIQHFLSKYFFNVQEQAMEADSAPTKPDSISERDLCILCLDAIHHHLSLFHSKNYEEDISTKALISIGVLPKLAELILRYQNDSDLDLAVLRILTVLSVHPTLLTDFFQNGLIGELSRLLRSSDVRLSSSAAVCLANLSGEYCYRPGLYLLHPLYRTTTPHLCDTLLVHGLRGGVFVTWRQRDRHCAEPIGIIDVTVSDVDFDPSCVKEPDISRHYLDPEFKQVMEDLIEMDDEKLLADLEVVLHDIPVEEKRASTKDDNFTAQKKLIAMKTENQDKCNYTYCWPKDWLPQDCDNLRILGVNYWSTLSEWLERCPLQAADIATRAAEMAPVLVDAGVGSKPVVWLAHSMGGLIVKQMLVEAAQSGDPEFLNLSANTKAIVFYSTPHKGSALATMPRAAAAVLWPSGDVRQLQENSPTLLELNNTFLKFADFYGWETVSFAETLPTLVTTFKVPVNFVESISADLGSGVFYRLPLDHLCICKPATRQSVLYTTVLDILQRVASQKIELECTSPANQWVKDLLCILFKKKPNQMLNKVDESHNMEQLRWFEKILLETFTDDFTD